MRTVLKISTTRDGTHKKLPLLPLSPHAPPDTYVTAEQQRCPVVYNYVFRKVHWSFDPKLNRTPWFLWISRPHASENVRRTVTSQPTKGRKRAFLHFPLGDEERRDFPRKKISHRKRELFKIITFGKREDCDYFTKRKTFSAKLIIINIIIDNKLIIINNNN